MRPVNPQKNCGDVETITSGRGSHGSATEAAEDIYARLQEAGVEVLYDDRAETAGVKFNDADLMGLPVRIVVSARNLANDAVEIKGRSETEAASVPNADVVARVRDTLAPQKQPV